MQEYVPISYKEFYERVMDLNSDDFEQFCHRYQKIFHRMYRATKARPGDLGNDGIISKGKRVACYGFFRDTIEKDGGVASKLKEDFDSMMTKHAMTRTMVFMTKTEGIGPKTQRMKEKLENRDYQQKLYAKILPEFKPAKKYIQYVDIKDMFERLRDIKKGETWEYLLNHKLWVEKPALFPRNDLDDPAFMSEWLSTAVWRFDNPEAPIFLKHEELVQFQKSLTDKMDRDLRKYEVNSYDNIPYETWILIGTPMGFAPSFDVPKGFYNDDDDILKMELTPMILLKIVNHMIMSLQKRRMFHIGADPLFMDLFINARYATETPIYKIDFSVSADERAALRLEKKKWEEAFTNYISTVPSDKGSQ